MSLAAKWRTGRVRSADAVQRRRGWVFTVLPPVVLFIVSVGLWEAAATVFRVNQLLVPAPSSIGLALLRGFSIGLYWQHIWVTMAEALVGFVLGSASGIVVGIVVSQIPMMQRMLMPYIIAFQALPKVALAPLIVVWFGFGLASKVFVVYMLCFFPLLVNSIAGMENTSPEVLELMRSFSASRRHILTKAILPSALPYVSAGLEMAIVFSLTGAVIGEFVGAQAGLGVLVLQTQYAMDIPGGFAVFVVLSLLGIALSQAMQRVRQRVLFWAPSEQRAIGT
jgi:NitT/TauT family transport system permease protein